MAFTWEKECEMCWWIYLAKNACQKYCRKCRIIKDKQLRKEQTERKREKRNKCN